MRIVVVLPDPLGPSRPNTSPRWIVRSSASTATSGPNTLRSFSVWMAGPSRASGDSSVAIPVGSLTVTDGRRTSCRW